MEVIDFLSGIDFKDFRCIIIGEDWEFEEKVGEIKVYYCRLLVYYWERRVICLILFNEGFGEGEVYNFGLWRF